MLRKLLLSTTAFAVLSGAALAADLPSRTAPPVYTPPIPIFTWTGVYIGGDIGYAWGESNYVSSIGFRPSTAHGSTNPDAMVGGAFGGFNSQLRLQNGTGSWSGDKTAVGWTVGGGIEYAVTNNWSVRAEYRYTDYGHIDSYFGNANYNKHDTQNSVRVGFSYKFDTFAPLAPVVAKY